MTVMTAPTADDRPKAAARPPGLYIDKPGYCSASFSLREGDEDCVCVIVACRGGAALYLHGTPDDLRKLAAGIREQADWHDRQTAAEPESPEAA